MHQAPDFIWILIGRIPIAHPVIWQSGWVEINSPVVFIQGLFCTSNIYFQVAVDNQYRILTISRLDEHRIMNLDRPATCINDEGPAYPRLSNSQIVSVGIYIVNSLGANGSPRIHIRAQHKFLHCPTAWRYGNRHGFIHSEYAGIGHLLIRDRHGQRPCDSTIARFVVGLYITIKHPVDYKFIIGRTGPAVESQCIACLNFKHITDVNSVFEQLKRGSYGIDCNLHFVDGIALIARRQQDYAVVIRIGQVAIVRVCCSQRESSTSDCPITSPGRACSRSPICIRGDFQEPCLYARSCIKLRLDVIDLSLAVISLDASYPHCRQTDDRYHHRCTQHWQVNASGMSGPTTHVYNSYCLSESRPEVRIASSVTIVSLFL